MLHERQQVHVSRWLSLESRLHQLQQVLAPLMSLRSVRVVRVERLAAEWCVAVASATFMARRAWRT